MKSWMETRAMTRRRAREARSGFEVKRETSGLVKERIVVIREVRVVRAEWALKRREGERWGKRGRSRSCLG